MIVRTLEEIEKTDQYAQSDVWTSARFFVKRDGLGASFHKTVVQAGSEQTLWYKNHIEIVVITEGRAEIVDLANNKTYRLEKDSAYALTHDKHIFRALTEVVCYCVFLPGLSGTEIPDEDGSYS